MGKKGLMDERATMGGLNRYSPQILVLPSPFEFKKPEFMVFER
jgi:hypothetical protein